MPTPIELPSWLSDATLRLRTVEERDVDDVVAACRQEDVQRFTRVPSPYTDDDARTFVALANRALAEGEAVVCALTHPRDDRLLGVCGLDIEWSERTGEIGFWAGAEGRGRGWMTEAVRRLMRLAFDELGLAYVALSAATVNTASNRVALRAGFRPEGRSAGAMLLGATGDPGAARGDAFHYGLRPDDVGRPPAVVVPEDLVDDGVRLRAWAPRDVAAQTAACRDPEVVRWTGVPEGYTEDMAREWVTRCAHGLVTGASADLAVVDADTDELLGSAGFPRLDLAAGLGEIGYWAAPQARGRGVTTTAVRLLATWGRAGLGLARVELFASVENAASNRVAEKAGFVREAALARRLQVAGEPRDAHVWVHP